MLRRLASSVVLIWLLGFIAFAVSLPGPLAPAREDGVVVLTGGEGRIERGLAVLAAHGAPRLLVSGVDPEVNARQFAAHYQIPSGLLACCITLESRSVDTRSNALAVASWARARGAHSLRLVTSDWHMRRAAYELARVLPAGTTLRLDAVPTRPSLRILLVEYSKWLARRIEGAWLSR